MITTISEIVPGEKFKMYVSEDKLGKDVFKLRTTLITGTCSKSGMVHLSVSSDPFWFWCIHRDTKVFLVSN